MTDCSRFAQSVCLSWVPQCQHQKRFCLLCAGFPTPVHRCTGRPEKPISRKKSWSVCTTPLCRQEVPQAASQRKCLPVMMLSLTVASSSIALGPIRAQFRRHLVAEVTPGSGSPSLMQTANTASLLVKSSLASVGTVQLATPAQYCDATCIRCLAPSGTVGSSITLALSLLSFSVHKGTA